MAHGKFHPTVTAASAGQVGAVVISPSGTEIPASSRQRVMLASIGAVDLGAFAGLSYRTVCLIRELTLCPFVRSSAVQTNGDFLMSRSLLCAALTFALSGAAFAQSAPAPAAAPAGAATPVATPDFITAAGQSDQFEVQEGKMAQKMGSTAAVRKFGAEMVRDHTKTTASLMRAVKKAGMTPPPPPALRPDQQQMVTQLQGTSGADFDKAYLTQQVQSHQEALALQSGYASSGDTPAIKAAAKSAVPIVRKHLQMAQKMSAM